MTKGKEKVDILVRLVPLLYKIGRPGASSRLAKGRPERAKALLRLGYLLLRKGDREEAKGAFREVVRLCPGTSWAAEAEIALGNLEMAR